MSLIFGGPAAPPTIPEFDLRKPVPYATALQRVSRHRGRPSAYNCAICLGDAQVWAYRGRSEHEQTGPMSRAKTGGSEVLRWSPDPMDYMPLCRLCLKSRMRALASGE